MNPINERDIGALADAVRRRRQAFSQSSEVAGALERHAFRVAGLVDDLAEGESLNALDYMILRVAAVLHDSARPKAASPEASALLAQELLDVLGADDAFTEAVVRAVRRHAGGRFLDLDDPERPEEPETWPERLLHDACLIATVEEADEPGGLMQATPHLLTATARRIVTATLDVADSRSATPA